MGGVDGPWPDADMCRDFEVAVTATHKILRADDHRCGCFMAIPRVQRLLRSRLLCAFLLSAKERCTG